MTKRNVRKWFRGSVKAPPITGLVIGQFVPIAKYQKLTNNPIFGSFGKIGEFLVLVNTETMEELKKL